MSGTEKLSEQPLKIVSIPRLAYAWAIMQPSFRDKFIKFVAIAALIGAVIATVTAPAIAVESTTGEAHLRHHVSPNGYYRGRKVVKTKND